MNLFKCECDSTEYTGPGWLSRHPYPCPTVYPAKPIEFPNKLDGPCIHEQILADEETCFYDIEKVSKIFTYYQHTSPESPDTMYCNFCGQKVFSEW